MAVYGQRELLYAKHFADALVNNRSLRVWLFDGTKFAVDDPGALRLLHRDMLLKRPNSTRSWWGFHFRMGCNCFGCVGGKETDLLAVFQRPAGDRVAVHIEVKQPTDTLKREQAEAYRMRARCWIEKPPDKILPHTDAITVLLCSETKLPVYEPHLKYFDKIITFEGIKRRFPTYRNRFGPPKALAT